VRRFELTQAIQRLQQLGALRRQSCEFEVGSAPGNHAAGFSPLPKDVLAHRRRVG
jgi:hypothetical protein